MIETSYKYLIFIKNKKTNKKTYDIEVINKKGEFLGEIYWRVGFRSYVFCPQPYIDFDAYCLNDITQYINELMEERKI